jgi:hypothetical protein
VYVSNNHPDPKWLRHAIFLSLIYLTGWGVANVMSSSIHIKTESVVLPINFDALYKNENGKIISEKNNIFCHIGQYLGIGKNVLVLDNYEANTSYFPLKWRQELNPYTHLSREQGIESVPSYAAINEYTLKTGVTIDYLIMQYYDSSALADEYYKKLALEIDSTYHIIY